MQRLPYRTIQGYVFLNSVYICLVYLIRHIVVLVNIVRASNTYYVHCPPSAYSISGKHDCCSACVYTFHSSKNDNIFSLSLRKHLSERSPSWHEAGIFALVSVEPQQLFQLHVPLKFSIINYLNVSVHYLLFIS